MGKKPSFLLAVLGVFIAIASGAALAGTTDEQVPSLQSADATPIDSGTTRQGKTFILSRLNSDLASESPKTRCFAVAVESVQGGSCVSQVEEDNGLGLQTVIIGDTLFVLVVADKDSENLRVDRQDGGKFDSFLRTVDLGETKLLYRVVDLPSPTSSASRSATGPPVPPAITVKVVDAQGREVERREMDFGASDTGSALPR